MANEYAVNQADLVAVANAIRERSGANGSLVFPNGFAEAIASISGLPSDIAELSTGVYVPASVTTTTIAHGLSQSPNFAIVWTPDVASAGIGVVVFANGRVDGSIYQLKVYAGSAGGNWTNGSTANGYLTATNLQFSTPKLTVGTTYYWACGIFNTN